MFALVQQTGVEAPWLVHDLFDVEARPELHPDFDKHLYDVSGVPGIVKGWERKTDGSFGPFVPALDDARAERLRALRFDCRHTIIGGFESKALGAPHRYGSSDTDRENIDRAAMAAFSARENTTWTAQIQCAAGDGPLVNTAHTGGQVHVVSSDLHKWIEACRVKLHGLKAKVAVALTPDQVATITWN